MIDNGKYSSLLYYITDNERKKFQNTGNYKISYKCVMIINKASSRIFCDHSAMVSTMVHNYYQY